MPSFAEGLVEGAVWEEVQELFCLFVAFPRVLNREDVVLEVVLENAQTATRRLLAKISRSSGQDITRTPDEDAAAS